MEADTRVLRQLIRTDLYVVDEREVAGAILARAQLRASVARPALNSERPEPEARSPRRVRSFRLARLALPRVPRR